MRAPTTIALLALALAAAGAAAASTAGIHPSPGPPIPTPPKLPKPPKVPGEKTAWFQLVFEGTSGAERVVDVGGPVGPGCAAQLHEDIHENVTFGRGKGVVMEFVEYGPNEYGFQRLGRTGDASFNVVGKVTRTASGSADLVQAANEPIACQALQHYDLSKNADCGKQKTENAKWGLKVQGDHFAPRPATGTSLGGGFGTPNHCGEPPPGSAFSTGGEEDLWYQWPVPPQFIWEPIPYAKMFNQRYKAFKVDFATLPRPDSKQTGHSGIQGSLETTSTDWGEAHSTVRFIRCFPKKVAKPGQTVCA